MSRRLELETWRQRPCCSGCASILELLRGGVLIDSAIVRKARLCGCPVGPISGIRDRLPSPAMRIRFIAIALLTLLGAPFAASGQNAAGPPSRPNIVWISNEDMSPRLGVYGDTLARTPVLDRLAVNRSATRTRLRPRRSARRAARRSSRACTRPRSARSTCGRPRTACPSCRGRTSRCRRSTSRRFPSTCARPATTRRNRAKTDYQFGVPFTIWDDVGADGALAQSAATESSRSSPCSTSRSRTRARSFRAAPRAKGSRSSPIPRAIDVPPYYPDTPAVREELARMYDNIADMDGQVGEILQAARGRRPGREHDRLLLERSRRRRAAGEALALRLGPPRAAHDPVAEGLGSTVTPGSRQRRARQLHRSRADGARAGRRRDSRASPGPRARRAEGAARRPSSCSPRAIGWTSSTT